MQNLHDLIYHGPQVPKPEANTSRHTESCCLRNENCKRATQRYYSYLPFPPLLTPPFPPPLPLLFPFLPRLPMSWCTPTPHTSVILASQGDPFCSSALITFNIGIADTEGDQCLVWKARPTYEVRNKNGLPCNTTITYNPIPSGCMLWDQPMMVHVAVS